MGGVQALPDLGRERLPRAAGVLPGGDQRADDRGGRGLVVAEQLQHCLTVLVPPRGVLRDAHHGQQDGAGARLVHARVFEHLVEVHVEQPGGVLGPFDVPADPEQRLGDPTQHLGPLTAAAGRRGGRGRGRCPAPPAAGNAGGSRPAPVPARGAEVSTQVSLEPPPWLELTIRLPSRSATRVSPPGSTRTCSPSLTANGRRSMCRGSSRSPTCAGDVDSSTSSCAIHARGFGQHPLAYGGQLGVGGVRPDDDAGAAGARPPA